MSTRQRSRTPRPDGDDDDDDGNDDDDAASRNVVKLATSRALPFCHDTLDGTDLNDLTTKNATCLPPLTTGSARQASNWHLATRRTGVPAKSGATWQQHADHNTSNHPMLTTRVEDPTSTHPMPTIMLAMICI